MISGILVECIVGTQEFLTQSWLKPTMRYILPHSVLIVSVVMNLPSYTYTCMHTCLPIPNIHTLIHTTIHIHTGSVSNQLWQQDALSVVDANQITTHSAQNGVQDWKVKVHKPSLHAPVVCGLTELLHHMLGSWYREQCRLHHNVHRK